MERLLKPEKLDVDPNSPSASLEWRHWRATFESFLSALPPNTVDAKALLINHVSPRIFSTLADSSSYGDAMQTLKEMFEKPVNEVHARHRLATRKQQAGESLEDFLRALKALGAECNFKAVTASQYQEELVRDAFVSGLQSQTIRQRLLESKACDLASLLDVARVLDSAQKSSQTYLPSTGADMTVASTAVDDRREHDSAGALQEPLVAVATKKTRCFFCGRSKHERTLCPAREAICRKCSKRGHFAKVCRSAPAVHSSACPLDQSGSSACLAVSHAKRSTPIVLSSCANFPSSLSKAVIAVLLNGREVSCLIDSGSSESFVHPRIVKAFGLKTCRSRVPVRMASVSSTVTALGHTTATLLVKGRTYENVRLVVLPNLCVDVILGQDFQRLHESLTLSYGGELPPLTICSLAVLKVSPPRLFAHLSSDCHPIATRSRRFSRDDMAFIRKEVHRLLNEGVIEASNSPWRAQDSYPLPRIDSLVHTLAKYRTSHSPHLKQLRIIDSFIKDERLEATFAYLDDITICGSTQAEHDKNLENFLKAARKWNLTLNKDKCTLSTRKLRILGYEIENGEIRPDPSRLQPLRDLPVPKDKKSLQRALGLFAYYSQWIFNYSSKLLKRDIEKSAVQAIDESLPFEVETDASEVALAAVLNQMGRPVAFFSRTLQPHERRYAAVEKEAQAVVEAVRHWQHYLTGKHFTIKTDQRSVSFMFNKQHRNFDIIHRPGKDNVPPDVFSRIACGLVAYDSSHLKLVHEGLCHPGVTRLQHFVRTKNLPYSLEDIKLVTKGCRATQPFERLNLDFKGPLPGDSASRFLLCVVDEYSRFPFAFPCADTSSVSVIKALSELFCLFGVPAYVHSDRGTAFMSRELKDFLVSKGIACSRTTAYNPQGNGQAERYVGVIWKTITLALRSRRLPVSQWRTVLPDALYALRSLLCTATNATPHERMFSFARRSTMGTSLPTWLSHPGPALLKKHVRSSKADPLVEEVELLEANPQYAYVRFPDGRESTVSLRHLAPAGSPCTEDDLDRNDQELPSEVATEEDERPAEPSSAEVRLPLEPGPAPEQEPAVPRRSTRIRRPPDRLDL
uniref:RNA-directed DNA polymerase n=1 Tax=Trichuris muris TaxID=70415 RepID=A0A5S6Q597_TRIMR